MLSSLPRAIFKDSPDDFVVEELPAYEPTGAGDHVFVRFTKRDRTTMEAVRAMARELACDARAAGFAGMKDKRAVTTQSVSFQPPRGTTAADLAARARALALDGIVVHDATPHPHKMKAGHLAGNRFAITLRGLPADRVPEVVAALERVAGHGVPNAFGSQRFGTRGDNATRALAWLRGEERGPRDPRVSRLLWSSLQSAVFNAVLDERVADGTWVMPLAGDLLKLRTSGGLFACADVQTDGPRAASGEVSPTGPIIGARMRWPEGVPAEVEKRISDQVLGADFDLARTRSLGEGSRRALRLWVEDLRWEVTSATDLAGHPVTGATATAHVPSVTGASRRDGASDPLGEANGGKTDACMRVYFVLPKGAYATTVLAAAVDLDDGRSANGAHPADPDDRDEPDGAIAT